MDSLWKDFRFATRVLLKSHGFTAVALVALVLGIGANTAIFSVVNAVLLRPLPFRDPSRLVMVWEYSPRTKASNVANGATLRSCPRNQSTASAPRRPAPTLTCSDISDPLTPPPAGDPC